MFLMLLMLFMMGGSFCILLPWFMPYGTFEYVVWLGMTVMGIMMCWIGVMVLLVRAIGTHSHLFWNLPKGNEAICIHERRGGHGSFRRGVVDALEHIKLKDMIFKDTGGGTRVAGHRVIKTMETVNHNVPDLMAQYLYKIRKKYMVDSPEKLKELHNKLKTLVKPIPGLDATSIESQLNKIDEIKLAMENDNYKTVLLNMKFEDLQQMSELMYDGEVIHYEEYEKFQEAAAPYDMESYSKRREIHRMMQMINYRDLSNVDWMKIAMTISVFLILGGIAYTIFAS